MKSTPLCSVIIPAHNCSSFILETLESLVSQTLNDIQIIVIDDASTDNTLDTVNAALKSDRRIELICHDTNLGQSNALNTGILASRGEYIAFLDADDIAMQYRLEKQISILEKHEDLILVGGSLVTKSETYALDGIVWRYELDPQKIKIKSLFKSEFITGCMCFRRSAIMKHSLFFDPEIRIGADWDLSLRTIKVGAYFNIDDILIQYRLHENQMTWNMKDDVSSSSASIRKQQLNELGINPTPLEMMIHLAVSPCNYWQHGKHPYFAKLNNDLPELARVWFDKIIAANKSSAVYDTESLISYLEGLLGEIVAIQHEQKLNQDKH